MEYHGVASLWIIRGEIGREGAKKKKKEKEQQ